jgi:uncharacterized membrane protein YhaH (DUF805 family)
MDLYFEALKKYATTSGRASRREFWTFVLVNLAISIGLRVIDHLSGLTYGRHGSQGFLHSFFALLIFIPSLALAVRRMHDIGKSGWFLLVACIPFVGFIILYWYVLDGDPGDNAYGPNPKASRSA